MTHKNKNNLSQQEIEEEIAYFLLPRYFLKPPIEMKSQDYEFLNLEIDIGEEKIKQEDIIEEIVYNEQRKNKRKLF